MIKKIQKPFSLEAYEAGAKVETRDGHAVRILATDIKGSDKPILAAVYSEVYEEESIHNYTKDGSFYYYDGYDDEPYKLDLVVVKEVEVKCTTWKDIAEGVKDYDWTINNGNELAFKTEEEALAFEALYKLFYLRKEWIGDWVPDWTDGSTKHVIVNYRGEINADTTVRYSNCLSFPTEKMCDKFLETFRKLIEKARDLI